MAQQSARNFDNPLFREIHKNTWLKKVNPSDPKKVCFEKGKGRCLF